MNTIAINAISAKRGGTLTYLQSMLPELLKQSPGRDRLLVWRGGGDTHVWPPGIEYREDAAASGGGGAAGGTVRRLWFDQVDLPRQLRAEAASALFSSANFGVLRSPCRQVLLVRNAIYFDETFQRRVRAPSVRAHHALQRWLILRSIEAADIVLFPSRAMRDLVAEHSRSTRANWRVSHYGARPDVFSPAREARVESNRPVTVLNVGLYSDQKNLGVLLAAMRELSRSHQNQLRLELTAGFDQDWMASSPHFPNFRREREIFRDLRASGTARDVDWKAHSTLPDLYRAADIFVFPSYTESFGHPLVEAMSTGLPVVASDVPINRELLGGAGTYFPPDDSSACAAAIAKLASDPALRARLGALGRSRVSRFSWSSHAGDLYAALRDRPPPTARDEQ